MQEGKGRVAWEELSVIEADAEQAPRSRTCHVCGNSGAKYVCPRCNADYCQLACYKTHGKQCTEGFMQQHLVSEMKGTKATSAEREKMMETLKRVYETDKEGINTPQGYAAAEMEKVKEQEKRERERNQGDAKHLLDDEALERMAKLAIDGDLTLESLTPDQRAAFMQALGNGEVKVEPWKPWWLPPPLAIQPLELAQPLPAGVDEDKANADIARAAEAKAWRDAEREVPRKVGAFASSACVIEEEDEEAWPSTGLPDDAPDLPTDLLALSSLTKAKPSNLLYFNLIDILYSYAYCMRLCNGCVQDQYEDTMEAVGLIMALSHVLSRNAIHPSLEAAINSCLDTSQRPAVKTSSGMSVLVLRDVVQMLFAKPLMLRALQHTRVLFASIAGKIKQSAAASQKHKGKQAGAKSKKLGKAQRAQLKQVDGVVRKLYFMLAWVQEHADVAVVEERSSGNGPLIIEEVREGGGDEQGQDNNDAQSDEPELLGKAFISLGDDLCAVWLKRRTDIDGVAEGDRLHGLPIPGFKGPMGGMPSMMAAADVAAKKKVASLVLNERGF